MTDFMYVDIIVDTTKIMTAKVIGIYFCGYYRYRQTAISELCSYMYKKKQQQTIDVFFLIIYHGYKINSRQTQSMSI